VADITREVTGGVVALVADRIYTAVEQATPEPFGPEFLEHNHWGLALILAGQKTRKWREYMYGAGATLVFQELTHDDPFAIGTPYAEKSLALTAVLLGANMIMWGVNRRG